ncbi:unnamed protein product [Acanthoscelides obtectus]|uniref:Uncharacterized protein n=1 Tax=Acanthoscelides obtectus TaxID=200917 RepID=A0A9P0K953_ACAOB|nr:unnamed protein product [Acanthoscelides obtectus]CAK1683198.1 hypothetical protein AOBTE_LOCUS34129 [Acanthoscelides obtectus]
MPDCTIEMIIDSDTELDHQHPRTQVLSKVVVLLCRSLRLDRYLDRTSPPRSEPKTAILLNFNTFFKIPYPYYYSQEPKWNHPERIPEQRGRSLQLMPLVNDENNHEHDQEQQHDRGEHADNHLDFKKRLLRCVFGSGPGIPDKETQFNDGFNRRRPHPVAGSRIGKGKQSQRSAKPVDLHYFRPEINESSKWVTQIEVIKREVGWSDVHTLARIGRFLLRGAKRWFERWNPYNRDWATFRVDFAEAFPPKRNLGHESLATVTDHQESRVVRCQLTGINRVSEDFGALVTEVEVPEEHREGLEVILQDFSDMITAGNQGFILPVDIPKEPFHTLHMDCLGPLPASTDGYKHVLVVVDSKYCILTPMKSVTTAEAREKLQNVLALCLELPNE